MKSEVKFSIMNTWLHRFALLGFVVIFVLMGCDGLTDEKRSNQTRTESLEEMENDLLVFYDSSAYNIINSFTNNHPEIKIQKVHIYDFQNDGQVLKSAIEEYGPPDLILGGLTTCSSESIEDLYDLVECYEKGYIADISEYCAMDTTLDANDYFPETFEVFRDKDHLYAIPLGITTSCIVTSESKYSNSSFVQLQEGYTGNELMSVLYEELNKEKEEDEFLFPEGIEPAKLLVQLGGAVQTDSGLKIDETIFREVYEFKYLEEKAINETQTIWLERGKVFDVDSGFAYPSILEPRMYEGKFTASFWERGDAPATVLAYATTASEYNQDEGIKAFYVPNNMNGNSYEARVEVYGAIGAESRSKELAYELLRRLMDEKITLFSILESTFSNMPSNAYNLYPVNIKNASSMLEDFESMNQLLFYGQIDTGRFLQTLERKNVSEVEREKHLTMLNEITGLYCWNADLAKVNDIIWKCCYDDISDYKVCYSDILQEIN